MNRMFSFRCAELGMSYEDVYMELAGYLELELTEAAVRFAPDDAVARVRYFRRQATRRGQQLALAQELGIDAGAVFSACGEEGARILLAALRAKPRLTITTRAAEQLIDPLTDAMAR
ncbi:MAG: hypothetical protein JWM80_3687 [Cyanobacteria bacterium RYN_339]|nr:hypothetical protein [Cyanobacteria bacterium RYN_339]